jgi:ubiquinone/menaquinone biosynthesis C-methylase UbiE
MDIVQVYNNIAYDFSNTRYKIWNSVKDFIDTIKIDDINIDVGCGNGKNMLYRKELNFVGIDICENFVKICKSRNLNVDIGNILNINYPDNHFNNIICIAVIHHLDYISRIKAIQELFRICKSNGKIMIYVWSFQQPENSKRKFNSHDEMVPYKLKNGETYYRYYHLYDKYELENEINSSNINVDIISSIYENGNYCVILKKK